MLPSLKVFRAGVYVDTYAHSAKTDVHSLMRYLKRYVLINIFLFIPFTPPVTTVLRILNVVCVVPMFLQLRHILYEDGNYPRVLGKKL